ncbi:uncharacterized protein LOC135950515 [Calliphora vicina]|uniref:uncharacterized protein LOC135950515 n=1 Tax=Calliphora vicina TaxID=7373 RepID=UPI00325B1606
MDLIKEINEKYLALEAEVDNKLEKIKRDEIKFEKCNAVAMEKSQKNQTDKMLTFEEAMTRNANLLKSLEMTKARLRSRSTFSPVEQILENALKNYKMDLELSQSEGNGRRHHHTATENIYDTVP